MPLSNITNILNGLQTLKPRTHDRVSRQKPARNLLGDIFLPRKPVVCTFSSRETVKKLEEPKREQVLYFLDGNGENWLVKFLDSLTRNLMRKTMCFARRVPRSCVRGFIPRHSDTLALENL